MRLTDKVVISLTASITALKNSLKWEIPLNLGQLAQCMFKYEAVTLQRYDAGLYLFFIMIFIQIFRYLLPVTF